MIENPPRFEGDPLAPHSLSATELKALLDAERASRPFIAYRDQLGLLGLFILPTPPSTCTVGRRAEAELSIPWDAEVSGLHAELQLLGGELTIVDDGLSTNGTFVNGRRVRGRQRLSDGDRVRVGQTTLAFKSGEPNPAQKTVAALDRGELAQLTGSQRRVLIALCRPFHDGGSFTTPATNQQIASEIFLSVDAVKMHLRSLFAKFDLADLPQNQKRTRLAECALQLGLITKQDLA
jgi:hypothetical protein